MSYKKVFLNPGKEESLKRFHPWVFSGAIARVEGEPEEGEVVDVYMQVFTLGENLRKNGMKLNLFHFVFFYLMFYLLSFKKGQGGLAMESLGTYFRV